MTFLDKLQQLDFSAIRRALEAVTPDDVQRALTRERPDEGDIIALLSPAADGCIEQLARRSAHITERRFGKVIQLYAPLYLSNECVNKCAYCGFSHELDVERRTLTVAEAMKEADAIHDEGFRHILLVGGEDRRYLSIPYLLDVVQGLRRRFDSISIEIQPMSTEEYAALAAAGVDGLTLYQELYDRERYAHYHLAGPKRHYDKRILAMENGGEAGFRSLGIGVLLGLSDWRFEAVITAYHARFLMRKFWKSRIAISFPRILESAHHFAPEFKVSQRDLAHMLFVMRLMAPDAELVLSTRESAAFRDNMIGLGVTRMSAGSKTDPGGYTADGSGRQFDIEDSRAPAQVAQAIEARGMEPVWKDFDREFIVRSSS